MQPAPATMKAAVLHAPGQITLTDVERPTPRAGQTRIRLTAAALNHRDAYIRAGQYPGLRYPAILGSDGIGHIDATGPDGDPTTLGRRVILDPSLDWGDDPRVQSPDYTILGMPRDGTFAPYIVVPTANVHPAPGHLTDHQAAALPLAHLTAWRAVVTRAAIRPDERVLITGIGGGVALAAMQLALAHGARVFVTSSNPAKIAQARRLGAHGGFLYTDPTYPDAARQATGKGTAAGFDAIIDGAGGEGVAHLIRLLAPAGRFVFYGGTAGRWPAILPQHLFFRQISILATTMGTPAEFADLLTFAETHGIVPIVDRVYALADINTALDHLTDPDRLGKIVLAL